MADQKRLKPFQKFIQNDEKFKNTRFLGQDCILTVLISLVINPLLFFYFQFLKWLIKNNVGLHIISKKLKKSLKPDQFVIDRWNIWNTIWLPKRKFNLQISIEILNKSSFRIQINPLRGYTKFSFYKF